jgi:hypothetical protein
VESSYLPIGEFADIFPRGVTISPAPLRVGGPIAASISANEIGRLISCAGETPKGKTVPRGFESWTNIAVPIIARLPGRDVAPVSESEFALHYRAAIRELENAAFDKSPFVKLRKTSLEPGGLAATVLPCEILQVGGRGAGGQSRKTCVERRDSASTNIDTRRSVPSAERVADCQCAITFPREKRALQQSHNRADRDRCSS